MIAVASACRGQTKSHADLRSEPLMMLLGNVISDAANKEMLHHSFLKVIVSFRALHHSHYPDPTVKRVMLIAQYRQTTQRILRR